MLRLSIIVPMYKSEWCISDCINSLYKQDLPLEDYEIIAVDNGSPDGCANYIRDLQKQYTNLRLINLVENRKPSGARNAGMDAAKGKYIMFVDSDDMLIPNVLHSLVEIISSDDLDFLHFSCDELKKGEVCSIPPLPDSPIMSGVNLLLYAGKNDSRFDVSWCKIYKRSFLNDNHLRCNEDLLYEDTEFAYRLFVAASRAKHVSDKIYIYRNNDLSETQNHIKIQALQSDINEIKALYQDIITFKQKRVNEHFMQHINRYIRWLIAEVLRLIPMFSKDEQKMLYRQFSRVMNLKLISYISLKKYIRLKINTI